jgi:hypothetical protein
MDLADGPELAGDYEVVRKALAKAVLRFQNEFLRSDFKRGSLCQVGGLWDREVDA